MPSLDILRSLKHRVHIWYACSIDRVASVRYEFVGDGLATQRFSPFMQDPAFERDWSVIERHWAPGLDVRWRVWILRQLARHAAQLEGSFVEFGTYRGGCAAALLATEALAPGRGLYLFDTFGGIPDSNLNAAEAHFAGRYFNTSPEDVRRFLAPWDRDNARLVVGDVFESTKAVDTGPLAFAHIDLNAAAATRECLAYVTPRLVRAGVILLDDYGASEYSLQRTLIDEFALQRAQPVIALPTGQAILLGC